MIENCIVCMRTVLVHSHFITCSLCKMPCHIRCLHNVCHTDSIYVNRTTEIWFCPKCIGRTLPFTHFSYDVDFLNVIIENQSNRIDISFASLDERIFNPFEINDDASILPLTDIDPDLNFYNSIQGLATDCNYYFQESFNIHCKKRI